MGKTTHLRIVIPLRNLDNNTILCSCEGRKYRGDAVNIKERIVIEIEGGIYPFFMTTKTGQRIKVMRGCHGSISGIERDIEKHNAMTIDGWRSLRYTPETLKKRPYQIIRDIRMMCGASTNQKGQTILCFDDASTGMIQVQSKLTTNEKRLLNDSMRENDGLMKRLAKL